MGYHIREIEKQQVGTIEKILEEEAVKNGVITHTDICTAFQKALEKGLEV